MVGSLGYRVLNFGRVLGIGVKTHRLERRGTHASRLRDRAESSRTSGSVPPRPAVEARRRLCDTPKRHEDAGAGQPERSPERRAREQQGRYHPSVVYTDPRLVQEFLRRWTKAKSRFHVARQSVRLQKPAFAHQAHRSFEPVCGHPETQNLSVPAK